MTPPIDITCDIHGSFCEITLMDNDTGLRAYSGLLDANQALELVDTLEKMAEKIEKFAQNQIDRMEALQHPQQEAA